MRCSHNVAFELVAQDLCVASLGASRHRLSYIGEGLVTVKPAELDRLSVQLKTMIRELRLSETKSPRVFINNLCTSQQTDPHRIQLPVFEVPQFDSAQRCNIQRVSNRLRQKTGLGHLSRRLRDHILTIEHLGLQCEWARRFQMLQEAIYFKRGMREYVFRANRNILDERRRNREQRDLAIDSSEGQIVDLVSEWRNIRPLG